EARFSQSHHQVIGMHGAGRVIGEQQEGSSFARDEGVGASVGTGGLKALGAIEKFQPGGMLTAVHTTNQNVIMLAAAQIKLRKPQRFEDPGAPGADYAADRKSIRLNSSHVKISYAVFCLK